MKLLYIPSHRSAKSRYLVHSICKRQGERFLGGVWRVKKVWVNNHDTKSYATRRDAAMGLIT